MSNRDPLLRLSRACWLDSAPPTLLERGSRHCHGINYGSRGTFIVSIAAIVKLTLNTLAVFGTIRLLRAVRKRVK